MATSLVEIYIYEVKDGLFHSTRRQPNEIFSLLHDLNRPLFVSCSTILGHCYRLFQIELNTKHVPVLRVQRSK